MASASNNVRRANVKTRMDVPLRSPMINLNVHAWKPLKLLEARGPENDVAVQCQTSQRRRVLSLT